MDLTNDTAEKVAESLLQIKAIKLEPANPFTWASGWKSPIYCDNRKILSYPKIRTFIRQEIVKMINEQFGSPDVIAGVATGAIAHGAFAAQDMGLPFVYVRSEEKKHGLGNIIEGVVESGQSVVVIEDLVSTGGSSIKAVNALRNAGCKVKGMVAIFSYGFDVAQRRFEEEKCPLFTLTDYSTLINVAVEGGYIKKEELSTLEKWREAPDKWGK